MDNNIGGTIAGTLGIILIGAIALWSVVVAVAIYLVTAPPVVIAFWRNSGVVDVVVAVLIGIGFRTMLLALRLGVLRLWSKSHSMDVLARKAPALWIELIASWFILLCGALIVGLNGWPSDLGWGLLAGTLALSILAGGCYQTGNKLSPTQIANVGVGFWFIPLRNVHSKVRVGPEGIRIDDDVPRVPAVEIEWAENGKFALLERSLATATWIGPIVFIVMSAAVVRFV